MAARITVLLFASAREAVGRSTLHRPIPGEGVAVGAVLEELRTEYPRLTQVLKVSRIFVNGRIEDHRGFRLRGGDELAVHPPYSGG